MINWCIIQIVNVIKAVKKNFYVKSMNLYYDHFLKTVYLKFKMLKEVIKEKKITWICLSMQCLEVYIDIKKWMMKNFINDFKFVFNKINFNYLKCF